MTLAGACAGGGSASTAVTAALHFYAAAQCLLQESWPVQASICSKYYQLVHLSFK